MHGAGFRFRSVSAGGTLCRFGGGFNTFLGLTNGDFRVPGDLVSQPLGLLLFASKRFASSLLRLAHQVVDGTVDLVLVHGLYSR